MGVHNLWELLAPVGRRVSVETLAGKKLAIDASIWMIQFMKAMRDEKGEMVRNAHILGFFRRICKLLFLRTKPVFVFDGGTPALKRRTVIARRRQRENAQAKIRKTAEKLLLNHLKEMRLKELAKDLENQRQNNDTKGKRVITDEKDVDGNTTEGNENVLGSYNQEALDEMLAASLAAEEGTSFTGDASASGAGTFAEEEDGDEDEEIILPTMHGKVDPAVLAALPPSMQLDLLVQMRERLMAENRQKYQKVKKAPARFSELQIQAYLKTVAFRREIGEVQKSAAGRGIGGVQTSRIASEANREFIFSSSFTGDKQVLTSAGAEGNSNEPHQTPITHSTGSLDGVASTKGSNDITGLVMDEPRTIFDNDDVETYLDERGRVRVSRVRAMGFRMTRDLQRNLDLMKESEKEGIEKDKNAKNKSTLDESIVGVPRKSLNKIQLLETPDQGNDGTIYLHDRNEEAISRNRTSIEVSFEDDVEDECLESDDDLFARLVAGDPVLSSAADAPSKKQSFDSASDCEWEEGVIADKDNTLMYDVEVGRKPSIVEHGVSDESEVQWEEGSSDIPEHASPCPPEYSKTVSKGAQAEECDFQEAIKRSLEDLRCHKYIDASSEDEKLKKDREMANDAINFGSVCQETDGSEPKLLLENVFQLNETSSGVVDGVERLDSVVEVNIPKIGDSPGTQLPPSMGVNPDNIEVLVAKPCESYRSGHPELLRKESCGSRVSRRDFRLVESVTPTPTEEKGVDLIKEQLMDTSRGGGQVPTSTSNSGFTSHISDSLLVDMTDVALNDAQQFEFETAVNGHSAEKTESVESLNKGSKIGIDDVQNWAEEKYYGDFFNEEEDAKDNSASMDGRKEHVAHMEASLEEEMLNLSKERIDLGDEQRKLERNAESVSSEMFAECQELLQMFGLPYIIAPMEAEAQCAYMELANLVDGVVTDDSDVFLFGARSVYKNIFDDRKYVETYFMKDIESELGITREKLIRMALLLGSDYTEGVSGIGIVNAIEVVNAFPEEDGLQKFRDWIESPDPTILGKVDLQAGSRSRKRGSKVGDNDVSCSNSNMEGVAPSDQNVSQSVDDIQNMKQIFMDKHRNVSKNWHIPSSFPSEAVISAYDSPQVDKSTEPVSWGKPDQFVLRKLCWEKFGWATQKADELLVPVLKEYNKHETQLRLEAFYTFNERFAKIRSKRIKKAVKGIMGKKSLELMDDSVQDDSKSTKKRKVRHSEAGDDKPEKPFSEVESGVVRDKTNSTEKLASKQSRKRTCGEPFSSDTGNSKPPIRSIGRQNTSRGSNVRGKGGARGRSTGRGRRKQKSNFEYAETSSDDGKGSDSEQEVQVEKHEGPHEVRRSTRSRKAVKYTVNDLEMEDSGKTDQDIENSGDKEAGEEEPFRDEGVVGDAAASPSKSNHHKVGDPSLEEGFSRDYLEMEGIFCMDEAEPEIKTGQLGSGPNGVPLSEAELSQEYLKMGGGFCLDEDEVDQDPDKCASSPAREITTENPDTSHRSGFVEVAEHEHDIDLGPFQLVSSPIRSLNESEGRRRTDSAYSEQNLGSPNATTNDNHSNVRGNMEENNSGKESVRSLRAMPNLRRKKRRS